MRKEPYCLVVFVLVVCASPCSALAGAPVMDAFPTQTAVAGIAFVGPPPQLRAGSLPVYWSIFHAPTGMTVNPLTGIVLWEEPVQGNYEITLSATNTEGSDYVAWGLVVVQNEFRYPVIISSKYVDFVVPPHIAEWMEHYGATSYADACWELMRDTVGHVPPWGRQVLRYAPDIPMAAGNGNPAAGGSHFWHNEFEPGWTLGAYVHEVGHNFHGLTNMGRVVTTWADKFFHHGTEFMQTFVALTLTQRPDAFISQEAYEDFCNWEQWLRADYERVTEDYRRWLGQGGRAEDYAGGYHAWGIICRELADNYGVDVLQRVIRAVRTDGLPISLYDMADTDLKVNTIMFRIISEAAGADLRDYFDQWGFDVDQPFWEAIESTVAETMANLPAEDYCGWKRSPLNGHYYRYTSWPMTWHQAEREAKRLGGHLATIRSLEEDQWVVSRFSIHRPCWIGYTDWGREGHWAWISGEESSYERWNSFEPNGHLGENHAAMLWGVEEGWNDALADTRIMGLIEVPVLLEDDR